MGVRLCITTMNRPKELAEAVKAALRSDLLLDGITVIDNSSEHYATDVLYTQGGYEPNDFIQVITLPHNAGLGPALNLAFALYDDYLVCQNDDVAVHRDTLAALAQAADTQPEYSLFYGDHDGESMFSLFLLRKQAFLEVGGFDPAIWPIYYDDIDILYRLSLAGHAPLTVKGATYEHVKNGTIKAFDRARKALHDRQFSRNEAYYKLKWGGLKFEEKFKLPFNGEPPTVPPLIKL